MARYILLSSGTGYIMGDTADFAAGRQADIDSPEAAARLLDSSVIGDVATAYKEITIRAAIPDGADGYYVYRADVGGSEAVPVATDGTDQEMIDAVERDCEFVAFVQRG